MFDLQGHRGARGLWPENTLGGFARALSLGVSALELDCGVTRDGVVVVSHDPELNPDCTRNARGEFLASPGPPICGLTYAQLEPYDVGRLRPGSAYAARFPDQTPLDGEHIPRLADALTLVRTRGRGQVRLAIEIKTFPEEPQRTVGPQEFVEAVRLDLERTGTASLVSIMAFDWRVLSEVKRLMPEVPATALTEQQPGEDTVRLGSRHPSPWLGGLDPEQFGRSVPHLVKATGASAWGPDYLDLDAQLIESAHALGLRVVPWTVNKMEDMQRLIDLGVDGLTTDRPDVLRSLLERRGMAVPPPPRQGA